MNDVGHSELFMLPTLDPAQPVRLFFRRTPPQKLTRSCIAGCAVIKMVGAPTASRHLVALPDNSTFSGNAIVPLQKVERCKGGRR